MVLDVADIPNWLASDLLDVLAAGEVMISDHRSFLTESSIFERRLKGSVGCTRALPVDVLLLTKLGDRLRLASHQGVDMMDVINVVSLMTAIEFR